MKKILFVLGLLIAETGLAVNNQNVSVPAAVVISSASSGFSGSVTATIPAAAVIGPYSTGNSNYFTNVHIEGISNGGPAGGVPLTCTTLNMGGMKFFVVPAVSTGTIQVTDMKFANPILSTSTALSLLTCPSNANMEWNIILGYFSAQ